jgi:hypothetical protein
LSFWAYVSALSTPERHVLALSSFPDEERVLPAFGAGAGGFLTRGTRPEEIAEAIRSVHRCEPVLCTEATRRVLHRVFGERQRPEGTVTVLFTDIVGSSQLLEQLGDDDAGDLFRKHHAVIREAVERGDGVEEPDRRHGIRFLDRGETTLKGLKGTHRLFEVDWRA